MNFLADFDDFIGIVDKVIGELADVDEAILVDADIDEGSEGGDVCDESWEAHAFGEVGGFIDALGEGTPDDLSRILTDSRAMTRLLGVVSEEVHSAILAVSADDTSAQRLEALAKETELDHHPVDDQLMAAGLALSENGRTRLRTPWFADLILAD